MMEQVGKVVDIPQYGKVTIEIELKSACNHCSNDESCGTKAISKAFSKKTQRLNIHSTKKFKQGDLVKIGLPESIIIKSAALVYLFPLLGLFLGAFLAQSWHINVPVSNDTMAILSAFMVGIIFWFIGKQMAKKLEVRAIPIIISNLGTSIT